jgi:hypothetical protein
MSNRWNSIKKWWQNQWKSKRKYIWTIFFFLLPYLLGFGFICLIGYPEINGLEKNICWKDAVYKTINALWLSFISFVLAICTAIYQFNKDNNEKQEKLTKELDERIDRTLSHSKIVFENGINEFNDEHLLAFQRILAELDKKELINIYAIDNSDPRTWWSDTMIGYLALLSKSKHKNNIHRIFVCRKNELLSPIFAKTIGLHSLMGFKTYIIVYEKYKEILNMINRTTTNDTSKKYDIEKEVFLWTENENQSISPISFSLDKLQHSKKWINVKCYQSFWPIDSDYHFRKKLQDKTESIDASNYYGKSMKSKDIDIWFEFIAKEKDNGISNLYKNDYWEKLPECYLKLMHALLAKMICCKEAIEIPVSLEDMVGIEIKTQKCPDEGICPHKPAGTTCINHTNNNDFDFTTMSSVRRILQEYYNKL